MKMSDVIFNKIISIIYLLCLTSCVPADYGDKITGLWKLSGINSCEDEGEGLFYSCPSGQYNYQSIDNVVVNNDIDQDGSPEYIEESILYLFDNGKAEFFFSVIMDDPADQASVPVNSSENEVFYKNGTFSCGDTASTYRIEKNSNKIFLKHKDGIESILNYALDGDNNLRLYYFEDEEQYIDLTRSANSSIYASQEDCTYTVPWPGPLKPGEYSVKYDGNGNTSGNVPTDSAYYPAGSTVTVPGNPGNLQKTGYEFSGWCFEKDGTDECLLQGETFTIQNSSIILYAAWIKIYNLRDTGPAGGLIFYDKGSYADGWRYMEAMPYDQSTGIRWDNGVLIWVSSTVADTGKGRENTDAIIAAQGAGEYAASICDELDYGGYSDWFLPSSNEIVLMYEQLYIFTEGGFANTGYWSSYDGGQNGATDFYFNTGFTNFEMKTDLKRVRAARRF